MFTIGTMRLGLFQDGPEARAKPIPSVTCKSIAGRGQSWRRGSEADTRPLRFPLAVWPAGQAGFGVRTECPNTLLAR